MVTALQVEQMSRTEKLQVMEAIWTAFSKSDAEVESPTWHSGGLVWIALDWGQLDWGHVESAD